MEALPGDLDDFGSLEDYLHIGMTIWMKKSRIKRKPVDLDMDCEDSGPGTLNQTRSKTFKWSVCVCGVCRGNRKTTVSFPLLQGVNIHPDLITLRNISVLPVYLDRRWMGTVLKTRLVKYGRKRGFTCVTSRFGHVVNVSQRIQNSNVVVGECVSLREREQGRAVEETLMDLTYWPRV